jgi:hypothetical protein
LSHSSRDLEQSGCSVSFVLGNQSQKNKSKIQNRPHFLQIFLQMRARHGFVAQFASSSIAA